MPARGSVYDYVYQVSTRSWRQWLDNSQAMSIPANAAFQDIIVPTLDSVRNSWLLATLVKANSHVLWVGGTGTGKTLCISETLTKTLANGVFSPVSITFSAKSSASQTQGNLGWRAVQAFRPVVTSSADIIDSKCDRRRKGVFGPPLGKRYVVFVDDLSMPAKEQVRFMCSSHSSEPHDRVSSMVHNPPLNFFVNGWITTVGTLTTSSALWSIYSLSQQWARLVSYRDACNLKCCF